MILLFSRRISEKMRPVLSRVFLMPQLQIVAMGKAIAQTIGRCEISTLCISS